MVKQRESGTFALNNLARLDSDQNKNPGLVSMVVQNWVIIVKISCFKEFFMLNLVKRNPLLHFYIITSSCDLIFSLKLLNIRLLHHEF